MSSLTWKINRLRLMGASEILWRVQQQVQKKAAKLGWGLAPHPPAPELKALSRSFLPTFSDGIDMEALRKAADAVLAGRWRVFALKDAPLGFPPQWNRCPKTGTMAPLGLGKAIDYRREGLVGDIKYLWEPSRHLELVTLAQAWQATREDRYAQGVKTLLTSWLDQCPYPNGVHWTSSLELAVRLLNWAFAWHLMEGTGSPLFTDAGGRALQRRWLDAIYQHAHFISGYLSKHSSANNHLLGEYMGLFVASLTWPCWDDAASWRNIGQQGFEAEALLQNAEDGVNKEQAVYYQHEVMDMMLLCHLIGQAHGVSFSDAFMKRLEALAEFIAAVMDCQGHIPMIGDADDAQMVRLAHDAAWDPYRSLLASCALLFKREDFKLKAQTFDDKNRWLFGREGLKAWNALSSSGNPAPARLAFPVGGYYLLGSDWGGPREIRLVADAAPLGYLSIAAHGHADALAFTLSVGGEELLIDPGTFAYHTQKIWRNYFRSTAAHNTVQVDGLDQSEISGNFMWLQKAQAQCLIHEPHSDIQRWVATHDGYQKLPDPVTHRRELRLDPVARTLTILDTLECQQTHQIEIGWQWAENLRVTLGDDDAQTRVHVEGKNVRATLQTSGAPGQWSLFSGEYPRVSGWISRSFDEKTPSATTRWAATIQGSTTFSSTLRFEQP
jgi:hypothetical protein